MVKIHVPVYYEHVDVREPCTGSLVNVSEYQRQQRVLVKTRDITFMKITGYRL